MSKPTPPRNKVVPAKTAKAPRKPDTELLGEGHCTQQAQKNYVERGQLGSQPIALAWKKKPDASDDPAYSKGQPWNDPRLPWQNGEES